MEKVIKVENLSKAYRLGEVGTGTCDGIIGIVDLNVCDDLTPLLLTALTA